MSGQCSSVRLVALLMCQWRWRWSTLLLLSLLLLQCCVSGSQGARGAADTTAALGAGFSGGGGGGTGPLAWLLSDKGPFHHAQEFVDFTERYQQGFATKYKIYR